MNPLSAPAMALALQANSLWEALKTIGPLLPIFIIFYLVMIVPMMRQRKALQQVINNLKKGDKVITTGGIYGEVVAVDAASLILRIADNVRVKVARSAISGLEGEAGEKGNKGSQSS